MNLDIDKERAAFEAWFMKDRSMRLPPARMTDVAGIEDGLDYEGTAVECCWQGWKARATPLAPTPTAAEGQAEQTSADDGFARGMLAELARMGASPAGLSLAAQLFGVGACETCGYRRLHCRCAAAPLPRQAAVQADTDKLLIIIASAYQVAGAHDAPAHILDVLADPEQATAEQVDAMLPYQPGLEQAVPDGWVSHFGAKSIANFSGEILSITMRDKKDARYAIPVFLSLGVAPGEPGQ